MSLTPGSFVGPYEIIAKLGEGGMGEVYRARDTRLNRPVALKVLPASVATDPDRLRRLQREAQLLASLNHPQIATVHGLEASASGLALVMELLEGDDLRQRLARGPVPLAEALQIARQIALALEAAHGQGIVHRDLKPANIKVRSDGAVKVLDFGLAKAVDPVSSIGPEDTPTVTAPAALTVEGAVMGTAAYMSPEQARGHAADKRSDIWAFGGVLYEMLTGRQPFLAPTISDTLAAVLRGEPDWTRLPAGVTPAIGRLLRRCLEKDPARRLHDIADARIEIEDALGGGSAETPPTPSPARQRSPLTAAIALVAVAASAAAAGWFLKPAVERPEMRLNISTQTSSDVAFALSPDGRKVVYAASADGPMRLWIRSLDEVDGHPLAGTERGTDPFWSPDGKSIAFFSDAKLKRVDIDEGSVKTLASNVAVPLGGTWSAEGTILFNGNPGGPILRIAADGSSAGEVTRVELPERGHYNPYFLPGGRRFLFYMSGNSEISGLWIGDLEGRKTRLFAANSGAVYAEPGYIVFARGKQVLAQRFDADRAELSGEVLTLGEATSAPKLSSSAGAIAYRFATGDSGQRQLVWVDRTGKQLERVVYGGFAAQGPAISHDGRHVAVFRFLNGNMDVWSYDRRRAFWDRITFDVGDEIYPVFSPDDRSIIYAGVRKGAPLGLYKRLLAGPPESEQLITKEPGGHFSMDWSPDGKHVLLTSGREGRGSDILAVSLDGAPAEPFEVVATEANEGLPQFSPDGKWIAYESDKLGNNEVFIRPFPGPGQDVRISPDGGNQARWNPKANELYYVSADDWLMAVKVTFKSDGTADVGRPEKLFPVNIGSTVRLKYRQQYLVDPDGKSFVINSVVDEAAAQPIVLILNWKPGR